jgi:hypothetical protein
VKYELLILILVLSSFVIATPFSTELTVPQTRYLSPIYISVQGQPIFETVTNLLVGNSTYLFSIIHLTNSRVVLDVNVGPRITLWVGDSYLINATDPGVRITLKSVQFDAVELYFEKINLTAYYSDIANQTSNSAVSNDSLEEMVEVIDAVAEETEVILDSEETGIQSIFFYLAGVLVIILLLVLLVRIRSKKPKKMPKAVEQAEVKVSSEISSFNEYEELKKSMEKK